MKTVLFVLAVLITWPAFGKPIECDSAKVINFHADDLQNLRTQGITAQKVTLLKPGSVWDGILQLGDLMFVPGAEIQSPSVWMKNMGDGGCFRVERGSKKFFVILKMS